MMEQEREMINDERKEDLRRPVLIIAMKGHPGTGKSTIAHSIASALRCPLLDKDDIRDSTLPLQDALLDHDHDHRQTMLLNDLSYEVLWRVASTQLSLGVSVVIDSPLSRKAHLDRLRQLAADHNHAGGQARLLIVECKPKDGAEWRRRLQERGAAEHASWHKPATWQDLERLLDQYDGCYEYDVGHVPKLVLDTTAKTVGVEEHLTSVLKETDEAFKVFLRMIKIREPDSNAFIMMKMFCDGNDLEMAPRKYMKQKQFVPSMHTYGALIARVW